MSEAPARGPARRARHLCETPRFAFGAAVALVLAALAYDPNAEAAEPKRAFALVLGALCVSAWLAWPPRFRADGLAVRAGLGFLALSAVSALWGLPSGLRDLGTFFAALGAGMLGSLLGPFYARSAARLAALGIGGISAFFAVIAALQGAPPMQLHAGQGNPNWLGLLLSVTLPLSLDALFALRRQRLSLRALAFVVSLVQAPALYLSHSRVAWLGASVAILGLLFFARGRLRSQKPFLALLAGALLVLSTYAARSTDDVPVQRALGGRVWIWENAARAAAESFPFGAGLGRFGHAYLDAQGRELARLTPSEAARRFLNATTAHDEYLQAAVESGPLSAILLAATLLLAARAQLKQRFLGGASALLACFLISFGDSPLRQPALAALMGLVLGVPSQLRGLRAQPLQRASRLASWAALALVAFLTRDALRAWLGTRERTLAVEGEPERRLARLTRAARLDPGSGESQLEIGLSRLRVGDARAARDALSRADTLFADSATRVALGQAELALSHPEDAGTAFERALSWNFGSFRARLGLAEARLRAQRLDEAEREAVTARKLLPFDPRGRDLLDRIREAQMDR